MDAELDDDKDSRFEFMAKLFAQMLMHLLIYPYSILARGPLGRLEVL